MNAKNSVEGHLYADFHSGWGGLSEELFYYTSRYYAVTEAFLRCLSENRAFKLQGYKASRLSPQQRAVMASILGQEPSAETANALIAIVGSVQAGSADVDEAISARFPPVEPKTVHDDLTGHARDKLISDETSAVDAWLSLAERLMLATAINGHHVEVDLHLLGEHLDTAEAAMRSNLMDAILALHQAGYRLKNHPHLSHAEAQELGDEGAN